LDGYQIQQINKVRIDLIIMRDNTIYMIIMRDNKIDLTIMRYR